jgi:PAS domain S-box-containing protein
MPPKNELLLEIETLRERLRESEQTLDAIRAGQVDAIVVNESDVVRVYTLQTAERIYRTIIEQMGEAAATLTLDGTILFCNTAFGRLIGLEHDELVGTPFCAFIAPHDREPVRDMAKHALRDGTRMEVTVTASDGEAVPVFLSLCALEGTTPPILNLVATDLREQKRSERIVAAGRLAGTILENIGEAVLVCDPSGVVTHASRIAGEMFSRNPLGRRFDDLFDLTVRQGSAENAARLRFSEVQRGCLRKAEAELRLEDDRVLDLLLTTAQIHGAHGEDIGIVLTMVDITDRKAMEEDLLQAKDQLEEANSELENRVRTRTAELERANRAKDEFLANMSHEIRTPLSGVLGLTEILLHQQLPGSVHGDLEMIRSSAGSVMSLINDLFDLSRISQGKFEFHPTEFDLREMLRDALGPLEFQARSKDLDFSVAVDSGLPAKVICDRDRIAQVIKNLVSNAIKFTDRGFVRVEVSSGKANQESLRVAFTISDSGIGIPPDKQRDVFSAFTQLDPSYSKRFAGMGLGLAISKSLVEGMGGTITVQSAKGKGSIFVFDTECSKAAERPAPETVRFSLGDLPPMRILLAEDNPVNRLFLRRAFVTAGHDVAEVENGVQVLSTVAETSFDLILMDIQMPEMDGVEATRQIRSGTHGRSDIPIIALTAYAMKGDREKFLNNGMNGYVTKPVDFGELARTIAEVRGLPMESGK